MFEADDQMHSLVANFVCSDFWFEIERSKTALPAPDNVKLWIEIVNALARNIDDAEVGIAGTLHVTFRGTRQIAIQSRSGVQQLAQSIFEVTAYFIDAGDVLYCAVKRVESFDRLIARDADLLNHSLIDLIVWIHPQNVLACHVKNHFGERNSAQLSIVIEQPGDQLINTCVC